MTSRHWRARGATLRRRASPRSGIALPTTQRAQAGRVSGAAREVEPDVQPDRDPRAGAHGHASRARLARRAAAICRVAAPLRVLDVGSGGGVPGIPMAIARPGVARVMLEPKHKKARSSRRRRSSSRSRNVDVARGARRGLRADGAVRHRDLARVLRSRDVRRTQRAPCRAGRRLVAMKGVHPDEELARCRATFARRRRNSLHVPGLDAARHSIVMRRTRDDAHHRDRQPEGRRRQDDDRRQPRGEPGRDEAPRAAHRSRSAGQRDDGRRRSTSARWTAPSTGAARRDDDRRRARRCRRPAASTSCRPIASSPAPKSSSSTCPSARRG